MFQFLYLTQNGDKVSMLSETKRIGFRNIELVQDPPPNGEEGLLFYFQQTDSSKNCFITKSVLCIYNNRHDDQAMLYNHHDDQAMLYNHHDDQAMLYNHHDDQAMLYNIGVI